MLEARIALEPPGPTDRVCGVATLTPLDMLATKLLAHSDRWRDDAAQSRDLIDLAMMQPSKTLLTAALAEARGAYGCGIEIDLSNAIQSLRDRPHRLDHCMAAMQMSSVPKALLRKRIKALSR